MRTLQNMMKNGDMHISGHKRSMGKGKRHKGQFIKKSRAKQSENLSGAMKKYWDNYRKGKY